MKKLVSMTVLVIVTSLVLTGVVSGQTTGIYNTIISWMSNNGNYDAKGYVTKEELADILTKFSDEIDQEKQITKIASKAMGFTVKVVVDGSKTITYPAHDGIPLSWITTPGQYTGTGVFVSSTHLVTNNHVVKNRSSEIKDIVEIYTVNGEKYKAKIIKIDELNDLALLEVISDQKFPYVHIAENVVGGETAIVIGNPELDDVSLDFTITKGIVSNPAANDSLNRKPIQVDAAINSGCSGGPILNVKGELIGISYMSGKPSESENIGFGINTTHVRDLIQ